MAGATFKMTLHDSDVMAALGRIADPRLMPKVMKNLGELNVKQTRRRFMTQRDPEGKEWAPLNPLYASGKRGPGILREHGYLLNSIIYQAGADQVAIGTNIKDYGAIHQFGGVIRPRTANALAFHMGGRLIITASVRIPARPYLGAGPADRAQMVSLVETIIRHDWVH